LSGWGGAPLVLLFAVALLVFAASPLFADPCPQTLSLSGAAGCNSIITINANGSVTLGAGGKGATPYDGSDDQLVGVINNNAAPLTSLTLSGSNIFGFENDGICNASYGVTGCPGDDGTSATNHDLTYAGLVGVSTTDGSGGSGGMQHFSLVDVNNGTVFFDGGLAKGAAAFFSLENAPSTNGFTVGGVNGAVPEPSSIVLFGSILGLSMAGFRKRFSKK
jgi:hypothetical protein